MSIRHIVTWKLAAVDATTRSEHAQEVATRLRALPAVVADIERLEVGVNTLHPDVNWDVVLVADFADTDALERYQVHPAHQEVAAFVRSVVAQRAAVDYPV